jgi:hypothetical protein
MTQRALEQLLLLFERELRAGKFAEIDRLIASRGVDTPDVAIGLLSITRDARAQLPARVAYLARAEAALVAELGADRAGKLLEHRR